ncbi:MAG TPA: hypothetical protein VEQ59_21005, partial [Polyangiaceae bacterium]|nr:hypothetical protein [Polyangiaceae bacterium]
RVTVHIGRPLSPAEVRDTPLNELSERTRALLSELASLPLVNDSAPAPAAPSAPAPASEAAEMPPTAAAGASRDSA